MSRTNLVDTYRTKGLRRKLVEELFNEGIQDERVLKAMAKVPRHFFIDSAFLEHAYQNKPFSIGEGQTISQPYTVAVQTLLLDLKAGDKVLEIGTGSGYQSSILMELGADLYSVEYQKILHEKASSLLSRMGYKGRFRHGDGSQGWQKYAPYDAIIVTAGAPIVPETLKEQLAIGGRLIIPVGNGETQQMLRLIRTEDAWIEKTFGNFSFVPLLGKEGWGII